MKQLKSIASFILISVFITSCNKTKVEDQLPNGSPVFTAEGTFGAEEFNFEAGEDGAYMGTFITTQNGVKRYSGKLGTADYFVEIGIFQGDLDFATIPSIESLEGILNFAQLPGEPLAILSKEDFSNSEVMKEVRWYVDGEFAGINKIEILEPGNYEICAEVHFIGDVTGTLCNNLILGYELNANTTVHHTMGEQGALHAWTGESSVPIDYIDWYKNDVKIFTGEELICTVNPTCSVIMAEIHFANGVVRRKSILVDGTNEDKQIDDFSLVEMAPENQTRWDYNVVIKVIKDGKEYSSIGVDNSNSQIQLIDIAYFGKNELGKDVYKCSASVEANVKDPISGEIEPIVFNTSFGLEISE